MGPLEHKLSYCILLRLTAIRPDVSSPGQIYKNIFILVRLYYKNRLIPVKQESAMERRPLSPRWTCNRAHMRQPMLCKQPHSLVYKVPVLPIAFAIEFPTLLPALACFLLWTCSSLSKLFPHLLLSMCPIQLLVLEHRKLEIPGGAHQTSISTDIIILFNIKYTVA